MNWLNDIKTLRLPPLKSGKHHSANDGLCAMEMVAYMERLPHSDAPPCTCPVIAAYVRAANDVMGDDQRARLLPYLPRLVGTVAPELEQQRATVLALWAVRECLPVALRAIGLKSQADACARAADLDQAAGAARAAEVAAETAGAAAEAARAARAARAAEAAEAAVWAAGWVAGWAARAAVCAAAEADLLIEGLERVLAIGAVQPADWSRERAEELCT